MLWQKLTKLFLLCFLACCRHSDQGDFTKVKLSPVIYGQNSILPTTQAPADLIEFTEAIALQVNHSWFRYLSGKSVVDTTDLTSSIRDFHNICSDEAASFLDSPKVGSCTGFFIGPDTLMTAAHCLSRVEGDYPKGGDESRALENACLTTHWIVGYNDTIVDVNEQLYSCKKVLQFHRNAQGVDFAIVRVNKFNSKYFSLSRSHTPQLQDSVFSFSHLYGGELQFIDNGWITKLNDRFFYTNIDFFAGSSGSPIIRNSDNSVVGINIAGEVDLKKYAGCYRFNVLPQLPGHERSLSIAALLSIYGVSGLTYQY